MIAQLPSDVAPLLNAMIDLLDKFAPLPLILLVLLPCDRGRLTESGVRSSERPAAILRALQHYLKAKKLH